MFRFMTVAGCVASLLAMTLPGNVGAYGYGGARGGYTHVGPAGVQHVGYGGVGRDVPIGTGYTYRDLGYGEYRRGLSYGPYGPVTPFVYGAYGYPYGADYGRFGYWGRPESPYASYYGARRDAQQAQGSYTPPQPGSSTGYVVPGSTASSYAAAADRATAPPPITNTYVPPPLGGGSYVYSPSYSKGAGAAAPVATDGAGPKQSTGMGYIQ